MNEYVYLGSGKRGAKGVSTYVLNQIALDGVQSLLDGEMKGKFELEKTRKGPKVESRVDKRNKVLIDIEIALLDDADSNSVCSAIQKEVYESLLDFLEVTPGRVNVKVGRVRKSEAK